MRPMSAPQPCSTSTGHSSTRTTSTRSHGTARSARTGSCCRSGASIGTSGWAATSSSPRSAASDVEERLGDADPGRREGLLHGADRGGRAAPGARDLIEALKGRGHAVVLASSARARRWTTTSTCSTRATSSTAGRPRTTWSGPSRIRISSAPAREKAGGGEAVMVGDSTWDCEAARRCGVPTIALLTGGFSEQELRAAGAAPCSSRSAS